MSSGIATYYESGILSADPVELVRMLYRGAIDAAEKAREHLRQGDIAARSAQITRAGAIIAHLTFSVNRELDPALGANLVELYDYMQRRLLQGNLEQADQPLAEVSRLLSTLLDGWAACGPVEPAPMPAWTAPEPKVAEAEPAETVGAGFHSGLYSEAAPTEPAGAGLYGRGYVETAPPALEYGGYRAYGSYGGTTPVDPEPAARVTQTEPEVERTPYPGYAETVPAPVYGSYSGYSEAVPAPAYGGYAGYAGTVPAGTFGEAEPDLEYAEYAGRSWSA
jgi:flagellar protein FliS